MRNLKTKLPLVAALLNAGQEGNAMTNWIRQLARLTARITNG